MKTLTLCALLLCFAVLTCHASTIDYTLTVVNAPQQIGDFTWTIEHDGFITVPPPPVYDTSVSPAHCIENCDQSELYDSFTAITPPSNGEGCGIKDVLMIPDEGLVTYFSPFCDGLYTAFGGGVLPDVGVLGAWNWQWVNPDDTLNTITLTITDPPGAVPEPVTWKLLLCGLGMAWVASKIKL